MERKKVKKGMILAGGLGTRFLPATLCLAKELFPIGNMPIMMYHIQDLVKAGVDDILIVGNKLKEESFKNFLTPSQEYLTKIESDGKMGMLDKFNELMSKVKITYVNQDDETFEYGGETYKNTALGERGSAIAINAGKDWAKDEPFVVVNGDDLCFYLDGKSMTQEVADVYEATGDIVVYGKELPREVMYKYSSMVLGDRVSSDGRSAKMLDIIEKPATGTEPSNIMGFCRYVLTEEFFDRIFKIKPRANGEYNMTDVLQSIAQDGLASMCLFTGTYFDCGSENGYASANMFVVEHRDELN
jgi:UTP--glucose-1-phosphate uridylyltransferase